MVSAASLYLSSLRRPKLDVDHVEQRYEFAARSHTGPMPGAAEVEVNFAVSNTGASATVLEAFLLYDFEQHGASIWSHLEQGIPGSPTGLTTPDGHAATPPIVFERGDSRAFTLRAQLKVAEEIGSAEDFARQLATLERVEVIVVWKYRRPQLLRPWRRAPAIHRRVLTYSGQAYRDHEMDYWRAGSHDHLLQIAGGDAP